MVTSCHIVMEDTTSVRTLSWYMGTGHILTKDTRGVKTWYMVKGHIQTKYNWC